MEKCKLKVNNTNVLMKKEAFTGTANAGAELVTGARLLFTLYVVAIDPGATVNVKIKNTFSVDVPYIEAETMTLNGIGHNSKILTDVHSIFDIEATVTGGQASFFIGVSIYDNAVASQVDARIENAELHVDLNHLAQPNGRWDSVRIGNGITEVGFVEDRMKVAIGAPGIVSVPEMLYLQDGTTIDMNVDGSTTAKTYQIQVPTNEIWYVDDLRILLMDKGSMDPQDFGSIADGLTNGLLLQADIKGTLYTMFNIQNNMDLAMLFKAQTPSDSSEVGFLDTIDKFIGDRSFPIPLYLNGDDILKVTVQDDLTGLGRLRMVINKFKEA